MEEFPPNSKAAKNPPPAEKKIERVTSGEVRRKKKGLGKQFSETFIGGDARSAAHYVVFGVLIPAAKDALAEGASQGIEKLIFGESRVKRGAGRGPSPLGHVAYNRISAAVRPEPTISRRARARHDFDDIVLASRSEAEEVLERMFDLLSRYDVATVSDLYELTGIKGTHADQKWGWNSLRGSNVARTRNGYVLDLPEPEPLD